MAEVPAAILNRHSRAIRILTCLQSGPGFNAAELAKHLGVSRRTIYRDLSLIRAAGVRIQFDDRQAAYRLERDNQQHLLPNFETPDLIQLTMAAHGSLLGAWPQFHSKSRQAMSKLLCLFPGDVRTRITRMIGGCFVHMPSVDLDEAKWETAQMVLTAIGERICLRATVDDERGLRRTKIAPYRLDVALDSLQLTGRSSYDAACVTISVERMYDVELTDVPYEPPRAARFMQETSRICEPKCSHAEAPS